MGRLWGGEANGMLWTANVLNHCVGYNGRTFYNHLLSCLYNFILLISS